MKVLVTGARGFVGKAVVEKLRQNGIEVIELQRRHFEETKNSTVNEINKFNEIKADVTKKDEILSLKKLERIDAVVHTAGLAHQFKDIKKEEFWSVNVEGTENISELSKLLKIEHFILISSVAVYGNEGKNNFDVAGVAENSECFPKGSYAESKLEAEKIARRVFEETEVDLTILRLATVIGEEDPGNLPRLIKAIEKRRFLWIGKGINYKSLIHRKDVAEAIFKLLFIKNEKKKVKREEGKEIEKGKKTEIYNVSAEPLQMKEIVEIIARTLNKKVFGLAVNENILRRLFTINSKTLKIKKIEKVKQTVEKWLADDVYSSQKLKREYNYETKINIKEAIEREVKWFLKQ